LTVVVALKGKSEWRYKKPSLDIPLADYERRTALAEIGQAQMLADEL